MLRVPATADRPGHRPLPVHRGAHAGSHHDRHSHGTAAGGHPAKSEGTFAYNQTLPVPRTAVLAGDLTTWLVVGTPGLILGLLIAVLRFDLTLHLSWLAVPAVLLVALTTTTVGFAIAYAATPPVTNMTQLIVFIALMFSPINYPPDRLPQWLQTIHHVLPFEYMAQAGWSGPGQAMP
jgi:ABC-2 type transport system permease protein